MMITATLSKGQEWYEEFRDLKSRFPVTLFACNTVSDKFDLKKLISVIGATMDHLLVDFRDDKLYFISAGNVMPEKLQIALRPLCQRNKNGTESLRPSVLPIATGLKSRFPETE